ncbi:DNA-processing protein DprA [Williamsia sp. MIQD14]|uniref:DNA-processing protein DprA n=1 Tax=Williamsia sp. MIQD14 TaxID=3425703 RepID=UPI003DA1C198
MVRTDGAVGGSPDDDLVDDTMPRPPTPPAPTDPHIVTPTVIDSRELRAWAYLAGVAEPPAASIARLVDAVGVRDAAAAVRSRRFPEGHQAVARSTASRHHLVDPDHDLLVAERLGGRLMTADDEDWPAWALHGLSTAETSARGGPPLVLWKRGPGSITKSSERAVALVGSRAASGYGTRMAAVLATGLVDHGRCVISGGAYGIDSAAHRSALAARGDTVAVMACGLDIDYPTDHGLLFDEIARNGAVVTEYPPGMGASRHRFLARNRLVAALSKAVVVVEAGHRSGAKNTAAWARRLGIPLGAVPGPATSAMSVGCHALISDGDAALVGDVAALERLVSPDGSDALSSVPAERGETDPFETRVAAAIGKRGGVTPADIATACDADITRVRSTLARMEVHGRAVSDGATWSLPRR